MMWNTSGESFTVDHYPIIKIPQSQSEIRILKLRPRDQHQWINHPKKRNLLQREKHNKRISFFKKHRHKKCKIVLLRRRLFLLLCRDLLCCRCLLCRLLCRRLLCCCHSRIHLLPERVISSLNLSINKYFGRNAIFRHRIIPNHHFFGWKMTAFESNPD